MRRNLAPGCISSEVNLCKAKLRRFFLFFLSPAKVGSLEMQPGAKLRRISETFFWDPLFSFFCFFLAKKRLAPLKCNLEPNCGAFFLFFLSPAKVGSLEMQPGAKLRRISRGLYVAASHLHAAF